jgi:hypothetical protein
VGNLYISLAEGYYAIQIVPRARTILYSPRGELSYFNFILPISFEFIWRDTFMSGSGATKNPTVQLLRSFFISKEAASAKRRKEKEKPACI